MEHAIDVGQLRRVDAYLDSVPRSAARAEAIGPFTLFVNDGPGWKYYARPTPGGGPIGVPEVTAVRVRQRELGIPETFEWILELSPDLAEAARSSGLRVTEHPVLDLPGGAFESAPAPAGITVRRIDPGDDLALVGSVAFVGFGHAGTAAGETGPAAVREAAVGVPPELTRFVRDRMVRGITVTVAAFDGDEPVSVGSHQPVGRATEVVGVATIPAYRRRGIGAAVTAELVRDALRRGVETIFLSAGDEDIARVYRRLGFRLIGTAGAAEPPQDA
jgi:ribosomal protein S18 acetylase RimI-like enzyme